jgi:3-oxoacyl-[acyl-carrier-protein] synthase-3
MRAALEAVANSAPPAGVVPSSTELSVAAARRALDLARVEPGEVGMIVNAAVYHDDNVMEPANAAFIQHRLGANLNAKAARAPGTLAFDLTNGACGLLSGLHAVAGFLDTGQIRHGLVVTADIDPTPGLSAGYGYAPAGAAVLLGPGDGTEGFAAFRERSYPEFRDLYGASVDWDGRHHALRIREDRSWADHWLKCAEDALRAHLDERDLSPDHVDLLVTAPPAADAGPELARRAGLDPRRIVTPGTEGGRLHTAGLGAALAAAHGSEAWAGARRVLLLAGGAGITIAIAEYLREGAR